MCKFLCDHILSLLLGICLEVELVVALCWTFWGSASLFSTEVAPLLAIYEVVLSVLYIKYFSDLFSLTAISTFVLMICSTMLPLLPQFKFSHTFLTYLPVYIPFLFSPFSVLTFIEVRSTVWKTNHTRYFNMKNLSGGLIRY